MKEVSLSKERPMRGQQLPPLRRAEQTSGPVTPQELEKPLESSELEVAPARGIARLVAPAAAKVPSKPGFRSPHVFVPMKRKPKMRSVITSDVRFEFVIPPEVPAENVQRYMWGKMQIICRNLSKNGLKVTPTVPREYVSS